MTSFSALSSAHDEAKYSDGCTVRATCTLVTVLPMKQSQSRVLWSVLVCALAFSVVACSDGVDEATQKMQTAEALSDSLLTVTDMPQGWEETQRQVFEKRGNENPSIDPSVWCPAAKDVTKNLIALAGTSGADVEMQAETQEGHPRMMRLQAWANDDVEDYFRDAKEAVRVCDGQSETASGGATEKYSIIEGRDIGDESISWKQTTTPPPTTQTEKLQTVGRTTIARFGSIVMVLQLGDMAWTGSVNPMDEDAWWDIVELAGKKLDSLNERVHK